MIIYGQVGVREEKMSLRTTKIYLSTVEEVPELSFPNRQQRWPFPAGTILELSSKNISIETIFPKDRKRTPRTPISLKEPR
jgi:hypothetical protein